MPVYGRESAPDGVTLKRGQDPISSLEVGGCLYVLPRTVDGSVLSVETESRLPSEGPPLTTRPPAPVVPRSRRRTEASPGPSQHNLPKYPLTGECTDRSLGPTPREETGLGVEETVSDFNLWGSVVGPGFQLSAVLFGSGDSSFPAPSLGSGPS